ncbi:MAG: hypothetical protein QHJ81_16175 [Anaerolineae bacterium]|nr:hypothetical protein [Anaerolineae bacterium]
MSQTVSAASRRLLMALRLLCLMLIALHLLAPLLPEERAWGLWPYTYLSPLWRWLLALLTLLACLPLRLRNADCGMRNALIPRRLIPRCLGPRCLIPRPSLFAAIALAFAPLFWLGRIVHTRWGDAYILVNAIPHPEVRLTYNWQAPLDIFLHARFWALGHRLFGWADAMPAYWVLSTVAGVVFIFVLCHLADALGGDGTEKLLTFGLVASLGTMQLFFGYIESYTIICVGILAYLWLALRCLRGETNLLWPAGVLALTHGFHPSTLVLQPSLWLLGWMLWRQGKVKGMEAVLKVLLPSLAVGLGVLALMEAGGHGLEAFLGQDFPGGGDHRWLVPLLRTTTRWEHYTMFSWAHLLDVVNEQLLTAPVVLPTLLLVAALARRRLDGGDPALRFLLLAAGSYLFLTLVWNPDYGGRRDWDLFAPASLPLTVLAAYVLPRALPERVARRAAAWMLIAVQVMHSAAWVYQNTQPWAWP